ncbi:PH domain-containing protein [Planktothrix mougeotii]|uniref:PH domain-containing protein n=1 Tax=Planktothrix mougeotii LEGE 06226 TaxID=1828728 RepID=A0ABR9U919_9CYAN|nr:PH domain-containing protein [Planktothrix mougeotii]MBE9142950.1 PH domain-containing protein [Planktothrix mougeotii LEGE 06226]
MFKNIAADALGISDIGAVIKPADYNKVDTDDYIIHEEGEKIYFLIKSKTDEYCFTNRALIHLDGTSAMSKKRLLHRYNYSHHIIKNVKLETAGTLDMDIEIKFTMGEHSYSIDVGKTFIEKLKDLYKALIKISEIQQENAIHYEYAKTSLNTATNAVNRSTTASALEEQFKAINQYAFQWLEQAHKTYVRKEFGDIFEKFINN